jgi:heme exporter protein D
MAANFLWMGGYAGFIWPAYAIAFVVLGGMAWRSLRRLRAAESELERIEQKRPERPE